MDIRVVVKSTPLKNMKVSWDDESQHMEKHVPNHEPDFYGKPRYFHGNFQEQSVSHYRRVPANLPIGRQIKI